MNSFEEEEIIFDVVATVAFKKDKKRYSKSSKKIEKVSVIDILQRKGVEGIPNEMKPHYLKGQYKDCLVCHIEGDFLIIWIQDNEEKVIYLMRLGSHSELFK
ncbi:type II toxin-antitoxin system YafQ family toxin [Capnocytophaga sp. oral taxon 336]|uniref:type II toxin-antitoxin system YafQ family toxin n=1 Tax=Capnocytophaga sp. oral taxon 336 TaxID=712216 RepID=UPI00034E7507|nr:type II toxin-antitoxin system YafQ family toxin [Capnocytophaga sp. oral taxon 336]EPE01396.1 hypothetical protein HMPREF1528_00227 [Capnocytophaga sp. oral taxon 336 str. F0502]